ncbi:MAG: sigma-70 family RNA polymerase sigma factor [Oscillospiraceae bacterium]|nr:sigma-70 family RNA polymerase sigma factor [Oscillospiraceae bacterium]
MEKQLEKNKLAEMVAAAQNGEEAAFEALYREYAKQVYYFALKIMRDKEDAEDITQDVFITVCEKISGLQEPKAFGFWINRITANKCTDALRKRGQITASEPEEVEETGFAEETDPVLLPDRSLDNAETSRMIVEIVDALPDEQRLCVYYYYYEQLTIAQVAEYLGANENTVKKRLFLARDKIRKELERLNKEEGTKLYATAPLPLTPILKAPVQTFEMPPELIEGLWESIAAAAAAAGISGGSAVTAATAGFSLGAKAAAIAGSLLVAGGITAGVIMTGSDAEPLTIEAVMRPDYTVLLDNEIQHFRDAMNGEINPIVYADTIYLPLEAISRRLGTHIEWDGETNTMHIFSQ